MLQSVIVVNQFSCRIDRFDRMFGADIQAEVGAVNFCRWILYKLYLTKLIRSQLSERIFGLQHQFGL